jgi:hypothetical protein
MFLLHVCFVERCLNMHAEPDEKINVDGKVRACDDSDSVSILTGPLCRVSALPRHRVEVFSLWLLVLQRVWIQTGDPLRVPLPLHDRSSASCTSRARGTRGRSTAECGVSAQAQAIGTDPRERHIPVLSVTAVSIRPLHSVLTVRLQRRQNPE